MKAIGYARVSTTKQDLARQRDKITNFCNDRGYELLTIIEDFGISGASLEREGPYLQGQTNPDHPRTIPIHICRIPRLHTDLQTRNKASCRHQTASDIFHQQEK